MKRILALIVGFTLSSTIGAMELPQEVVCLKEPYYTPHSNDFKINAHLNTTKIGTIKYKRTKKQNEWEITSISVEENHRHTDKKVGFGLFKSCINDIVTKNPSKIEWTVVPQDSTLSLSTLNLIYRRMVNKLDLPNYTFKEKHFGYASEMALLFNNKGVV